VVFAVVHRRDYLGHADPRTTRRYRLGHNRLERTPAYQLLETLMANMRADAEEVGDGPPRASASAP
jgi:hypothetical protein